MDNVNVNANVDKEDSVVAYNDAEHKYWIKGSDKQCISVTTLIEKYAQPFDADFWSATKALETLMGDQFNEIKQELYRNQKINPKYFEIYHISQDAFDAERKQILANWKKANQEACERGTAIHKLHEDAALGERSDAIREFGNGGSYKPNTSNKIEIGTIAAYPEVLLHYISDDGELRLAGQADLVLVNGDEVIVLDYKTNGKIDKSSYYNKFTKKRKMMKYPLGNLMDCNYWHYAMQLSTYAWMIQQINPNFKIKLMSLIHYDHNGKKTNYEVPYLKKEVEAMLKDYKNTQKTHNMYNRLRPIAY